MLADIVAVAAASVTVGCADNSDPHAASKRRSNQMATANFSISSALGSLLEEQGLDSGREL
jgi:hypothetical protein